MSARPWWFWPVALGSGFGIALVAIKLWSVLT
jgi:hypothetical protein